MKPEAEGMAEAGLRVGGLAGWLLGRLRVSRRPAPRLVVLERVALAPRQSLALVEADGRRFLVATSPEGAPSFYALDTDACQTALDRPAGALRTEGQVGPRTAKRSPADRDLRVSW
jgi:flagellar biogenesis protein FliO